MSNMIMDILVIECVLLKLPRDAVEGQNFLEVF